MPGIFTDIDNLKKDIDKTDDALMSLYKELGEIGCNYHKTLACSDSEEIFKSLSECIISYEEINNRIDDINRAMAQMDYSDKEILQTNITIQDLDTRHTTLLSSLGAVACEVEAQGNLPDSLTRCMATAHEFEKTMNALIDKRDSISSSKNTFMSSIIQKRLEICKKNIDKVYYETGKRLFACPEVRTIPSERIRSILDQIDAIQINRANYKNKIQSSKQTLSDAENALKEENSNLKQLQLMSMEIKENLDNLYTEYGSVIAKEMSRWLNAQTPQELKDVCQKIVFEKQRRNKQDLNMDYLIAQRDIELNASQAEQYSIQLEKLKNQKAFIENQIKELENKIESANQVVISLHQKQSEIADKALSRD